LHLARDDLGCSDERFNAADHRMTVAEPQSEIQRVLTKRGRTAGKVTRWLLLGLLVVGAGFGVQRWRAARAKAAETHWLTEPVRIADVRVVVSATGKLHGLNTVEVGAEVTGKVLRVLVDYNEKVVAGQVLAEIDPEQLRAAVEQARAQLAVAQANIRTTQATLEEAKLLLKRMTAQLARSARRQARQARPRMRRSRRPLSGRLSRSWQKRRLSPRAVAWC
jgi:multidrug efflux pump subunit AcrA (membrane-fusion protein)